MMSEFPLSSTSASTAAEAYDGLPVATPGATPAGFWRRFAAVTIDGIIVGILNTPISYGLQIAMGTAAVKDPNQLLSGDYWRVQGVVMLVCFLLPALYFGYFYTQKGWSPGKKVMGMRVVNVKDGTRLTWGQAIARETVGKILSGVLLGIGYFMVAFRGDKRAMHDLLVGSQVLKVQE
jgi:uncharacterized RDD family membrane protein YckC